MPGTSGENLRLQIERAALCVPRESRPRVLGPLLSKSAPDDQVRSATGSLLLGKTFVDHGWSVEYEPKEGGGTPDFKITKGETAFVVEVRRVAAPERNPSRRDIARLRDAFGDFKTRTPISIRAASLGGGASLKPFVAYVKGLLAKNPKSKHYSFHEGEVFVGFEVYKRLTEPICVVVAWSGGIVCGDQHKEVRSCIDEKLAKYKLPLIVALDFEDFVNPFATVEDVLLGKEVFQVPIDFAGRGKPARPYLGRANGGILVRRTADGVRARARLQGVLAFGLLDAGGLGLRSERGCSENPAARTALHLREFAPIPRLVVTEETRSERKLRYLDVNDRPMGPKDMAVWRHVP